MTHKERYELYERHIAELKLLAEELRAENRRLKLRSNSRNSSLPPVKDIKRAKRLSATREKSNRKRGGQPGHEGKYLEMRQEIDDVQYHSAATCKKCGTDLSLMEGQIE